MSSQNQSLRSRLVTRRAVLRGALALAAANLLSACGATPTATPTAAPKPTPAAPPAPTATRPPATATPAPKAGTVTIQWQTANLTEAQYEPVWREMITKFQAQNPTIKIEPILVARADHWTKFVTAAKANQAPDVVSVEVAPGAYNGYLRPLDDLWNTEPESYRAAWPQQVLNAARYKGKLYGIPSWGGIYGEIYNKELVQTAGLDTSKPPATWQEYLDWCKKLTVSDQRWAMAILGGKTDTTTRMLLMWIWSNGGEAFNADMTQATFASDPKALEAIEFYLNLDLVHKVAAPGAVNINYLEQTTLFAQEKIATMRNAYWGVAKVVGDNPAIKGKIVVAFPPMAGSNKVTLATMATDNISKDCKNVEAAWKWIKFIEEKEWCVKRALISNWMPLRTDVVDDPEVQKDPMLVQFLEYGKVARAYPLPHPLWADVAAQDIVNAVQASLLKQGTIKDNFTKLDADLTRKFKDI